MSFIDLPGIEDAKELKTVPAGEYQLQIVEADIKTQKPEKGTGQYIQVRLMILGDDPLTKDIQHVMMIPTQQDDEKKANNRLFAIKNFKAAFGIPAGPRIDPEEWVGNTGWAILMEEEDKEFGLSNRIKKVVVPQS
jgi:hypothetical protein